MKISCATISQLLNFIENTVWNWKSISNLFIHNVNYKKSKEEGQPTGEHRKRKWRPSFTYSSRKSLFLGTGRKHCGSFKTKSSQDRNSLLVSLRASLKDEITSEIKSILIESQKKMLKLLKPKTGENMRDNMEEGTENETRNFYTPTSISFRENPNWGFPACWDKIFYYEILESFRAKVILGIIGSERSTPNRLEQLHCWRQFCIKFELWNNHLQSKHPICQ